jgi:predicted DCC family thiol-disulfide oxidoreductase YuxK
MSPEDRVHGSRVARAPERISVLYDEHCGFCTECVRWFAAQETSIEIVFVPRGSAQGHLLTGLVTSTRKTLGMPLSNAENDELIVIGDNGGVYEGPPAFVMCLWALPEYETWAERLSTPSMMPYARRFFLALSKNRKRISQLLGLHADKESFEALLPDDPVRCAT